jgi:archaemetzincin
MKSVYIISLGKEIGADIAGAAERAVWRAYGTETRLTGLDEGVEYAFDARRAQYNSVLILREVHRRTPADALKVLALTDRDLFIPMLSFVFGQAQLGGTVALVSVARLRQEFYGLPGNPGLTLSRTAKETVHEMGHTFGLTHCNDPSCPMSLSNSVLHTDRKGELLCPACRVALGPGLLTVSRT